MAARESGALVLLVDVAVAKIPKYAVRESGDSVEIVERPNGGLSVVMADGQRSGRSAKALSNLAVRKSISLLAEGVRDGAVMRAAHDYLRTQRGGQVSVDLTILSVDLETRTIVISRNSQCPVLVREPGEERETQVWCVLDAAATSVGILPSARPVIVERQLLAGQTVVAFTDGVLLAGERHGRRLNVQQILDALPDSDSQPAQSLADALLAAAVAADEGRPGDDTTVIVMKVSDGDSIDAPEVRRMAVSFPIAPI